MQLTVNGKQQHIEGQVLDLVRLLTELKVQRPDTVAVQVNGQFVGREAYESTFLREDDEVEFLYFMGGGS
jgi:sulfur carrier protein